MATIEEDTFDSDSGIWTVEITNGTSALVGGARTFNKTVNGWSETGMWSAVKSPTYGDTIEMQLTLDEVTAANTTVKVYWHNGDPPSFQHGAAVGCYFYGDGGVTKAHGFNSGIGVASNPAAAMEQGAVYTMSWYFTDPEGHLEVKIKGGSTWGETYQDLIIDSAASTNKDATTEYAFKSWQVMPFSTQADISILNYIWYDKFGPSTGGVPYKKFRKYVQQGIG